MKENVMEIELGLDLGIGNNFVLIIAACDIVIKNNMQLLEPIFPNKQGSSILFSNIWDIDYFNNIMKEFNNEKNIMLPTDVSRSEYNIIEYKTFNNLWNYSYNPFRIEQNSIEQHKIAKDNMILIVLKALKLNRYNYKIVNLFGKIENAIHIRTENDWLEYSEMKKNLDPEQEVYYIDLDSIINMYKNKWSTQDVFFTTGEEHLNIQNTFLKNNINSKYIYNNLSYIENAAINFELCCRAENFIGTSRSTFSNLISLNRSLNNKNNSYIYNINNEITLRVDKGTCLDPYKAINTNVIIE